MLYSLEMIDFLVDGQTRQEPQIPGWMEWVLLIVAFAFQVSAHTGVVISLSIVFLSAQTSQATLLRSHSSGTECIFVIPQHSLQIVDCFKWKSQEIRGFWNTQIRQSGINKHATVKVIEITFSPCSVFDVNISWNFCIHVNLSNCISVIIGWFEYCRSIGRYSNESGWYYT